MPWNPELINTKVSIYRPDHDGPGGDSASAVATVVSLVPGYVEHRDLSIRRGAPVQTASVGKRVDLWIQGLDASGKVIDVQEDDLIEWLTHLNTTSSRWEVDVVVPYPGPLAGGVPTIDHIKIEARP